MDPITIALLAAGAVQIGGAIISKLMSEGKEREAQAILDKARDEFGRIQPELLEKSAQEVLGPTAFEQVRADPRYKQAQDESLAAIQEIQKGGGLTKADEANLARMRAETARATSGRQAAIRQEMQRRGAQGVSGAELAQRQMAAQNEANTQAQQNLDIAGQAQKRYFDAIRERAGMAGQMRGQDFGEQSQLAQARDAVARYNHAFLADQARYNNAVRAQNNALNRQHGADLYELARGRAADIRGEGERTGRMIGDTARDIGGLIGTYGMHTQGLQGADAGGPEGEQITGAPDVDLFGLRRDKKARP